MPREVREYGWELLRDLKPIALDRFCQRVLAALGRLAADLAKTHLERYAAGGLPAHVTEAHPCSAMRPPAWGF